MDIKERETTWVYHHPLNCAILGGSEEIQNQKGQEQIERYQESRRAFLECQGRFCQLRTIVDLEGSEVDAALGLGEEVLDDSLDGFLGHGSGVGVEQCWRK